MSEADTPEFDAIIEEIGDPDTPVTTMEVRSRTLREIQSLRDTAGQPRRTIGERERLQQEADELVETLNEPLRVGSPQSAYMTNKERYVAWWENLSPQKKLAVAAVTGGAAIPGGPARTAADIWSTMEGLHSPSKPEDSGIPTPEAMQLALPVERPSGAADVETIAHPNIPEATHESSTPRQRILGEGDFFQEEDMRSLGAMSLGDLQENQVSIPRLKVYIAAAAQSLQEETLRPTTTVIARREDGFQSAVEDLLGTPGDAHNIDRRGPRGSESRDILRARADDLRLALQVLERMNQHADDLGITRNEREAAFRGYTDQLQQAGMTLPDKIQGDRNEAAAEAEAEAEAETED